ncbi:MAG TPA: MTH938/NDUFAF3 family protein [Xanthobacteraceae bacterium]|nr:MTH938/NDUFAF3 family protein [Xanthobacteraceae bacterium]
MSGRREPHYPGKAAIDGYGAGGFRFAGMSHKGSILATPSGIRAFAPKTAAEIDAASLAPVFADAAEIEILIIGTGSDIVRVTPELRGKLKEAGIAVDPMPTAAAISTYNILLGEDRKVAAALIAVE